MNRNDKPGKRDRKSGDSKNKKPKISSTTSPSPSAKKKAKMERENVIIELSDSDEDKSSTKFSASPLEQKFNVGDIVFIRITFRDFWSSAVVIDPKMCEYDSKNGKVWTYRFIDDEICQVDNSKVKRFSEDYQVCFRSNYDNNAYRQSIRKAIELYAKQLGIECPEKPLKWASTHLSGSSPKRAGKSPVKPKEKNIPLPDFILDRLASVKKTQQISCHDNDDNDETDALHNNNSATDNGSNLNDSSDEEIENSNTGSSVSSVEKNYNSVDESSKEDDQSSDKRQGEPELRRLARNKYTLKQFCICCGVTEPLVSDHPLFEGRMCKICYDWYKKVCFVYDDRNKKENCSICGDGGDLFLCGIQACSNVYCILCIGILDSNENLTEIIDSTDWICYLCEEKSSNMIRPYKNWKNRLYSFFKITSLFDDVDLSLISQDDKQPIRVLSLFDGIGTAKLVLDELGLEIGAYYRSEIDHDANLVTKVNHANAIIDLGDVKYLDVQKLEEIGPIDLVIGGSPCNDLSIANPGRKGLYDASGTGILFFEYYRILQNVLHLNRRDNRNTFWLYENVVSMKVDYRSVIERFLGCMPAVYNSCYFSAQNRARHFWGNIPEMYNFEPDSSQRTPCVQDILVPNCGRVATVEKVRTVTTCSNSLKQGKKSLKISPVEMNGKPDTLWTPELETLFGLPDHYTDVGNLSGTKRQKLIGKGWTVPVVKHILRPLVGFFKTSHPAEEKIKKNELIVQNMRSNPARP